jgi:Fic family protein
MFEPKYTLTNQIINNISQIERFYGQLEGLRLPKKLELNLKEKNLVQSAYVSNSIEGNPLSLREVTNLLLSDRLPVNRDEKEVTNYFDLLTNLDEYIDKEINIEVALEIHKKLLSGVQDKIAGNIRNDKVVIGKHSLENGSASIQVKHEPPYHKKEQIEKALNELFDWVKNNQDAPTPVKAGSFHHQFVYIHPFSDGNGRVCRLLTALVFLKDDYRINKYFVLDDYYDIDRIEYSDKLHTADFGDKTEWLTYFTDGVKYSLQSALDKAKKALVEMNIEDRLTNREAEVLDLLQQRNELTSAVLADTFEVSRQQAHNLLSSLVDKGFIEKKGSTKSSYYILK